MVFSLSLFLSLSACNFRSLHSLHHILIFLLVLCCQMVLALGINTNNIACPVKLHRDLFNVSNWQKIVFFLSLFYLFFFPLSSSYFIFFNSSYSLVNGLKPIFFVLVERELFYFSTLVNKWRWRQQQAQNSIYFFRRMACICFAHSSGVDAIFVVLSH